MALGRGPATSKSVETPPPSGGHWIAGVGSAALTLLVFLIGVVALSLVLYRAPGPKARAGASTTVIFRKGAHTSEIAADLERAGVVYSGAIFMAAAEVTRSGSRLKAGEYAFPSRASVADVVRKIRSGDVVHHRITIPEGATSKEALMILMHSDVLSGPAPLPPEGSILPETYEVVRGEPRAAVLQRMMEADDRLLTELWAHRRAGLPYINVEQAVVLASIVEKETAVPSERPLIAGVYLNRLRQGMKLEADPTIVYGLTAGAPLGHGIRESELHSTTPYNTYVNPGLPPGPIDNPGRAALAAALDPTLTDNLFFVADGSGGHAFAKSLSDHARNVEAWRQIEKGRAEAKSAAAPPLEHR